MELNEFEKAIAEKYKKLLIERDVDFNKYRYDFIEKVNSLNETKEILEFIKNELIDHYKSKSIMLMHFYKNSTPDQRMDEKNIFFVCEIYDALLKFIEDQKVHYENILTLETPKQKNESGIKKMKWNSSPSVFGHLFFELAKNGFIDFPLRNGDINPTGLAKDLLELFEVNGSNETIIHEFNPLKQSLSVTKRAKFQIPQIADLK